MAASRTAQYVALYRALETVERDRPPLFQDPYAKAFLSRPLALAVRAARVGPVHRALSRYADVRAPGARSSAIARTRSIDEVVRRAVANGADQMVVLGAGFDCRAHRMPELAHVRVFEVDRGDMQSAKREHLASASVTLRTDIRYVTVDFQQDDVATKLTRAGWKKVRRTVFVWEGVTNYLSARAVTDVLSWVSTATPGSTIVFTYIHGGLLDGTTSFPGGQRMMRNVRALGEPWTFGLRPEEVRPFLGRFGLVLDEDLGADEYRRRWLGERRREPNGYGFYRMAVAHTTARGAN